MHQIPGRRVHVGGVHGGTDQQHRPLGLDGVQVALFGRVATLQGHESVQAARHHLERHQRRVDQVPEDPARAVFGEVVLDGFLQPAPGIERPQALAVFLWRLLGIAVVGLDGAQVQPAIHGAALHDVGVGLDQAGQQGLAVQRLLLVVDAQGLHAGFDGGQGARGDHVAGMDAQGFDPLIHVAVAQGVDDAVMKHQGLAVRVPGRALCCVGVAGDIAGGVEGVFQGFPDGVVAAALDVIVIISI